MNCKQFSPGYKNGPWSLDDIISGVGRIEGGRFPQAQILGSQPIHILIQISYILISSGLIYSVNCIHSNLVPLSTILVCP